MKYGGVDLRNRVVGARLLKKNLDPFFYKWQKGDSVELLDPRDKAENEVNMVTVPPSVLVLIAPFSGIKYNLQRILWFFIQWILFLLSIYFYSKSASTKRDEKIIWLLSLFVVGSSFFWRLHVERGQIYIFYVFLISLVYYFYQSKLKFKIMLSGLVLGFAMIIRPTLALIALPFIVYKNWKFIFSTIVGGVSLFIITLLFTGWKTWHSYFSAMKIHGVLHLTDTNYAASNYPFTNIEGIGNLYGLANIPIFDSSLQFLFKSVGIRIQGIILLFVFVIIVILFFLFLRRFKLNNSQLFLLGSFLVFLVDFFLPAARFSYNNVMFLPILAMIILERNDISKLIKEQQ